MAVSLDLQEALTLLDRAIAERGEDYVYTKDDSGRCTYFYPDGQPGCIVGQVLAFKGVSLDDLRNYNPENEDFEGTFGLNAVGVDELAWSGFLEVGSKTEHILALAQNHQDSGLTWAEAVRRAKEDLNDDH